MGAILTADPATFCRRRQTLARRVGDGVVVLSAAAAAAKSRDTDYHPYCPDKYLYYLTGFSEPAAALLMHVSNGETVREIVLCRPRNPLQEQWQGARLGPLRARRRLGIAHSGDIADFDGELAAMSARSEALYYLPGNNANLDLQICQIAAARRRQNRNGRGALRILADVSAILDDMRTIKDSGEIALLRQAAKISSNGQRAAMRAAMHAKSEYQIEAALTECFRAANAHHAFAPIVAAGKNACTLHYTANSKRATNGMLVLADAGAEYAGYAGDISRTFPIGGRFSPAQAAVYDAVLIAQRRALAVIKPGVRWERVEKAATHALCKGLAALGLCAGTVKTIYEKGAYQRFYMHRLGHFLGLDVHDVGYMKEKDGSSRRLRSGMVLTVEPGLYITDSPDIPPSYRGIGVRLEDTVVVRPGGCETLTEAPKTRAEITAWMRG